MAWQSKNGKGGKKQSGNVAQLNRLSLLLTLVAVLFFTGVAWALGRDGRISYDDGLVLVGLFLFWQCFHVYEVMKTNVQKNRTFGLMLLIDLGPVGGRRLWNLSQHRLVGELDLEHQVRVHQRQIPRLVKRLVDGLAQCIARVLLRLEETAGSSLHVSSWRWSHLYPALHRNLRTVSAVDRPHLFSDGGIHPVRGGGRTHLLCGVRR